jgi:homoserine dehydrogenase
VKRVQIAHIGAGTVGGAAIEQEIALRAFWRETLGIDVVIGAVIGSDGAITADRADGLSDELLARIVADRRSGVRLAESAANAGIALIAPVDAVRKLATFAPVIAMDAGAGTETLAADLAALDAGGGVVLSNKAPMAMPDGSAADQLWHEAGPGGRVRYEATVGAGLPVLSTARTLIDSGDQIIEITGTVSGTFGAIFSDLAAGNPFSVAVRTAKANGYTEPDPRDDLSGLDVARKALILARTIGRTLDLTDITIESLVPTELTDVTIDAFLERITLLDEPLAVRAAAAAESDAVLKYVLSVGREGPISVGVAPVAKSTVLGALQGPENIVSFRTTRYDRYPLVVSGPGAGAAVTAAGMTADVLALANTLA